MADLLFFCENYVIMKICARVHTRFNERGIGMFYQNELDFLRAVFKKCRVKTCLIEQGRWDYVQKQCVEEVFENYAFFQKSLHHVLDEHLYMLADPYDRGYAILRLPNAEKETILCIGPFLRRAISKQQLLDFAGEHGISEQKHSYLIEYYNALPILGEESELLVMLNASARRSPLTSSKCSY